MGFRAILHLDFRQAAGPVQPSGQLSKEFCQPGGLSSDAPHERRAPDPTA